MRQNVEKPYRRASAARARARVTRGGIWAGTARGRGENKNGDGVTGARNTRLAVPRGASVAAHVHGSCQTGMACSVRARATRWRQTILATAFMLCILHIMATDQHSVPLCMYNISFCARVGQTLRRHACDCAKAAGQRALRILFICVSICGAASRRKAGDDPFHPSVLWRITPASLDLWPSVFNVQREKKGQRAHLFLLNRNERRHSSDRRGHHDSSLSFCYFGLRLGIPFSSDPPTSSLHTHLPTPHLPTTCLCLPPPPPSPPHLSPPFPTCLHAFLAAPIILPSPFLPSPYYHCLLGVWVGGFRLGQVLGGSFLPWTDSFGWVEVWSLGGRQTGSGSV